MTNDRLEQITSYNSINNYLIKNNKCIILFIILFENSYK